MKDKVTFSKQQINYLKAKAILESINEETKKRMEALGYELSREKMLDEEYRKKYLEKESEIELELGWLEVHEIWCAAREQLLEWGFEEMKKSPKYKLLVSDIEEMKEKLKNHPDIREKIIDLTMKMQVA